ncbi:MAG: radical SAM protein [bacterium]
MNLDEKRKKRLASEYGETWNPVKGGVRVALVYPNSYSVGMSNLGFQAIYHILNQRDDVTCERVFLPDREGREKAETREDLCRSFPSGRLLRTFDILAFSVSFELDYVHLVEILQKNKIPPLRSQREYGRDPMVWIGGVALSINPEPLADFADVMFIGEAEEMIQEAMDAIAGNPVRDREGFKLFSRACLGLEGVYFPHAYAFDYDSLGRVDRVEHDPDFPQRIRRRWIRDLDRMPTVSRVMTPDTELNDMFLVELDRGCGRHCRFCAAGYIYRPPRFRSLDGVMRSVREGLSHTDRIGLVGAAVSDYPRMSELVREIRSCGARISVSSLRADSLTPELMSALAESGHKTISLAPEGGSQRMREIINKGIEEKDILNACRMALGYRILNLRLYFMVGLPSEETVDIEAIADLVLKIREIQKQAGREQGRIGRITVSLNSFVPKPHTPFQWFPMNKKDALAKKIGYIKKRLHQKGNITVIQDLPKWSVIQGLLSRGDRRVSSLLVSVVSGGGNWAQALKESGEVLAGSPFRERERDEIFPWDIVEPGCRRDYLYQEYQRSASGRLTPACPEDLACHRCGVCGESEERHG